MMLEQIISAENSILALIIRSSFNAPGIHFCTPENFSQQLAVMSHPQGKTIPAHVHNFLSREVAFTQEVLIIKKGKLRVDFYDTARKYFESRILESGDVILLASGGHGFEVLEELEMIEVKQGPYTGDADKTRFPGIPSDQVIVRRPSNE